MSNNEIDIHMSDLDEETKRILAEDNPDAQSGTDDSKNIKKDKKEHQNDDYNEYEVDDRDPLVDKEMDDKEW